ncbi:MAG TPA: hypothetical protein VHS34_14775 [Terriglobales bacterium]|nr:hypothetical protein [Terriglobales bacterium]
MKLSAILSVFRRTATPAMLGLLVFMPAPARAAAGVCEASAEIRVEMAKAAPAAAGPSDFDRNVAPALRLRQRYPNDLLVHEMYQDAVQRYGIEGHLRKLVEDYQVLSMQHSDEVMYSYLYARSLIGRNTPSAVRQINEILAQHPDFAPGHRALAEIYASETFLNDEKEKVERTRFLALCPGSALQQRPGPLPTPSRLIGQAELLLAGGDPAQAMAMALQGIRDDEWRLQRIRPFDWYSVAFKRQAQSELQVKYWTAWSIEVRCDRRLGQAEKAADLLAQMEQRAAALQRNPDPVYWDALAALARLYGEGNQEEAAARKLEAMQEFLAKKPDPQRAAQLEGLRKLYANQK